MDNPTINKQSSSLPFVALIFILLAFAAAFFYVKPTWDAVTNLDKSREEKITQRNEANDQLVELQNLQKELQESSEVARETTLAAIPESLEQDKLIEELGAIAEDNKMVLSSVNFGTGTSAATGEVTTASVNASLAGNKSSLLSFLRDVESNERKILVKSITVQFNETDIGISTVNFNVNMETYYQGII